MDKAQLEQQYEQIKAKNLHLDMSRGKPSGDVLDLSNALLNLPTAYTAQSGLDCRNYGVLDGLPEAKTLLAPMLDVGADKVIIGGNSSLQMMYDTIVRAMLLGVDEESEGWSKGGAVKFICPVPGYDRHFALCESLGIVMIPVPVNEHGVDMDVVEELVANDTAIKGMWCVPIYSNPTGVTYSDDVVRRLARMKTAAKDFRLMWDCAYSVHVLSDTPDRLLNVLDECEQVGNPDRVYMFASTSKVTFPGSGVALMASSRKNVDYICKHMSVQTIGSDKLNQLRHFAFFKNFSGITAHMKAIQSKLAPKFNIVFEFLERELGGQNLGEWHAPKGGYFISFTGNHGTAKRTVRLCKDAGVILTAAGATFPYGKDPDDSNIRLAPTFPTMNELEAAMEVFCVSVKLANC
ncbi:MAG: aminotransferase class I/II-fold pyridoxal phosphate-dependent enzyme [Oscillospiraceae bacterium]|nr:aminotransferase class I/II-fold pyridoxal phosphate-dependent enzyme [Oscillospiraceae bacterium]